MTAKIGMVSLGCSKNRVDAEAMLEKLKSSGFEITPVESEADVLIINTCGFIEDAKTEAIENIIEAASYKKDGNLKSLIVTGCLAERYGEEIFKEMPEVDVIVGLSGNKDIVLTVKEALNGKKSLIKGDKELLPIDDRRILTTPFYTAYLKIAEGCDNCCTYCAIPKIRGRFRSRTIENVVNEAKDLAKMGVKEIIVIAQDTTRYGEDIYGSSRLPELLKEISAIEDIHWIRILYTYPERITEELLIAMRDNEKIVNYLDIPIQHCQEQVLKRMNRRGSKETLAKLLEKIRTFIPGITIRTTLITGFPGESEDDFTSLCEFVKEQKFDRLGCFAYSAEEGTPAAEFEGQIDEQIKVDRSEIIMSDQMTIAAALNEVKIGSLQEVLVEGYDDFIKCWFGRSKSDAPEIDGKIFFMAQGNLSQGDFVNVRINDTIEYDLLGEMEE